MRHTTIRLNSELECEVIRIISIMSNNFTCDKITVMQYINQVIDILEKYKGINKIRIYSFTVDNYYNK